MSLGAFKDLCIDANDAAALGRFWSLVLGLELHHQADGDAYLIGPTPAHTVWINQVPEPKAVKHRIHLDVYGSSATDLRNIGASIIDDQSFNWVVMADPEGGEFCLFTRDSPPPYRLHEVVVDCVDHEHLSRWWASAIGGRPSVDERGFSFIADVPGAPFEAISFLPVEEAKGSKNRIHLDVVADGIDGFLRAGASLLRGRDDEIGWDVLADPEGNEFCVFVSA